jgi:uncharacterized membrane protein
VTGGNSSPGVRFRLSPPSAVLTASIMRRSTVVLILALGIAVFRFAMRMQNMPDMLASHFGPGGSADAWMSKDVFLLFALIPLVVSLAVAFLGPMMVEKLPASLINLPNKDYWLAPSRKAQTVAAFKSWSEWFAVGLLIFMAYVFELVFDANQSGSQQLANAPFITALITFFAFALVWMVVLYRRFQRPR